MPEFYHNLLHAQAVSLAPHFFGLYVPDMHKLSLTAILTQEPDGGYVALNPETGTASQGDTLAEALANLKEATELYLEEFPLEKPVPAPVIMTTFELAYA